MTYLERLANTLAEISEEKIAHIAFLLNASRDQQVFVLGNGGSQANASHLVLHLIERRINAHDISSETAWLTANSNDYSFAVGGKRRLELVGKKDDILVVISGSGNSANIISSLRQARLMGMKTVGILGFGGGQAREFCDVAMVLPQEDYAVCEDAHSVCLHMLSELLQ